MTFEIMRKIKKLPTARTGLGPKAAPTILAALMLAATPVGAGILGVDVDVGVGKGGVSVGADVGVGKGGVSVGADVGVGGVGATADVGIGGVGVGVNVGVGTVGATPTPGTPTPGVVPPTATVATGTGGAKGLLCAKGGDATAYNGYVVRDRRGTAVGVVHEVTMSSKQKLTGVRLLSTGMACYNLTGATFRVRNGEIWANVDANSFK